MPSSKPSRTRTNALAVPDRLVDTHEAASLMGLTEETLLVYRSIGKLRADVELTYEQWLKQGRPRCRLFYKVSSLVAYMKRTRPSYPRSRK
jgi:hypothetical protein